MNPARLRRERAVAIGLAVVAAVLGLLSASRTWVTADITDALTGRLRRPLSGGTVAPLVPALSVVVLAAAGATLLGRRLGRALAGLVLVAAGAACAAAAASAAADPGPAVAAEVVRVTGRSTGSRVATSVTPWPWLAVVAGVLAALAGALVVLGARRWAPPPGRFDVARGDAVVPAGDGPALAGDARAGAGAPQAGEAGRSDAGVPAPDRDARDGPAAAAPAPPVAAAAADAWDALSRGEDPTR